MRHLGGFGRYLGFVWEVFGRFLGGVKGVFGGVWDVF